MKAVLQTWFFGLPLLWSRVYTLGLPSKVRDDRLTKIASDVYEQRAASDAEGRSNTSALEVLFCVILSVRADLLWRFERGHKLRVASVQAGRPPFPVVVTALFALAGIAGAVRLSAVHHLPADELTASVLALLVGPLVAVLGVLIARQNAVTGILALVAGSIALMAAAGTIVALVAAALGMVTGLFSVFETRRANRGPHQPGGEPAPGSSPSGISPLHRAQEGRMLSPRRLERWMLVGVLGVVIGLVTAGLYAFSFPHGGTDDEILGWYSEDRNGLIYSAFLGGIASGVGLLLVFGGIYGPMRSAEGGAGILSVVMLAAATTATSLHMVASTLRVSMGMVYQYDPHFGVAGVDPQLVRYIEALAFGIQSMSSAILAIAVGALATVSLRTRQVCPAWLGWLTAAVAVLLFLDFPLFGIPFTVFVGWAVLFATTRLLLVRPDRQPGPGVSQGSEGPEVNLQASPGSAE